MGSGLTVDPALGSGQFADMREVATRDWTHLRRQERDHGQRLTGEGHKLHLIAFVLTVDVHNCSDIASHQVFRWQILGQDDAIVFFDHHQVYRPGYAVISRGAISPRSNCQMVLRRILLPSDVIDDASGRVINAARVLHLGFVFDLCLMAFGEANDFAEELLVNLTKNVRWQDGKFVRAIRIVQTPDDSL